VPIVKNLAPAAGSINGRPIAHSLNELAEIAQAVVKTVHGQRMWAGVVRGAVQHTITPAFVSAFYGRVLARVACASISLAQRLRRASQSLSA
jgi:hypothetical protein